MAALGLLLLLGPGAALAQESGAPDSGRVEARTVGLKPQGRFDKPRWVMIRSAVIPGWGQLHNGSWLKAAAAAGGEGMLGYRILKDLDALNGLSARVQAARAANDAVAELDAVILYNDRQTTLVARQWLLGGVVVYAMVDAYVDAHFRYFDIEFKHDPALPDGVPVRPQARLSFRWRF